MHGGQVSLELEVPMQIRMGSYPCGFGRTMVGSQACLGCA